MAGSIDRAGRIQLEHDWLPAAPSGLQLLENLDSGGTDLEDAALCFGRSQVAVVQGGEELLTSPVARAPLGPGQYDLYRTLARLTALGKVKVHVVRVSAVAGPFPTGDGEDGNSSRRRQQQQQREQQPGAGEKRRLRLTVEVDLLAPLLSHGEEAEEGAQQQRQRQRNDGAAPLFAAEATNPGVALLVSHLITENLDDPTFCPPGPLGLPPPSPPPPPPSPSPGAADVAASVQRLRRNRRNGAVSVSPTSAGSAPKASVGRRGRKRKAPASRGGTGGSGGGSGSGGGDGGGLEASAAAATAGGDRGGADAEGGGGGSGAVQQQQQQQRNLRDAVFDMVLPPADGPTCSDPEGLSCRLFPYQQRALSWMLSMEKGTADPAGPLGTHPREKEEAAGQGRGGGGDSSGGGGSKRGRRGIGSNCLYDRVLLQCGTQVYFSPFLGCVRLTEPPPLALPRGGVLADEMGLGKTVEVIALALAHAPPGAPFKRAAQRQRAMSAARATAAVEKDAGKASPPDEEEGGKAPVPEEKAEEEEGGVVCGEGGGQMPNGEALTACEFGEAGGRGKGEMAEAGEEVGERPPELVAMEVDGVKDEQQDDEEENEEGGSSGGRRWAGTLIVTPSAILQQWHNELTRHGRPLAVEVYDGLRYYKQQMVEAGEQDKQPVRVNGKKLNKKEKQKLREYEWWMKAVQGDVPNEVHDDARLEAEAAVSSFHGADVVLTTYDVLKQEVHYNPGSAVLGSLRHQKRYPVPQSPLVTCRWWRLVIDEAQMVGQPLTSVAVMADRISAQSRWCVTGTPIGAGGLKDVQGLLRIVQHRPLGDASLWARVFGAAATDIAAHGPRLQDALRPVMWRNSKTSVAAYFELPPRTLRMVPLRLGQMEEDIYKHILDQTRKARDELRTQQQQQDDGPASPSAHGEQRGRTGATAAAAAAARRRHVEALRNAARGELQQLRYACIHPQLTQYWKQLSSELQLDQGGALSMAEIMVRMRDSHQLKLQAKERELCAVLNVLAEKLLARAERTQKGKASAKRVRFAVGEEANHEGDEDQQQQGQGDGTQQQQQREEEDAEPSSPLATPRTTAAPSPSASPPLSPRGPRAGRKRKKPVSSSTPSATGGASPSSPVAGTAAEEAAGEGANEDGVEEDAGGAGSAGGGGGSPRGGVKRLRSTLERLSPEEVAARVEALRVEALEKLQQSWQVGEHGIGAMDASDLHSFDDIQLANASLRAWRLIQVHTCRLLTDVHGLLGQDGRMEESRRDLEGKMGDLRETADNAVAQAQSKLDKLGAELSSMRSRVTSTAKTALESGWPLSQAGDPEAWVGEVDAKYIAAQAEEKERRTVQEQAGGQIQTQVLLGTAVESVVSEEEGPLMRQRVGTEACLVKLTLGPAVDALRATLAAIATSSSAPSSAGIGGGIGGIGWGGGCAPCDVPCDLWLLQGALMRSPPRAAAAVAQGAARALRQEGAMGHAAIAQCRKLQRQLERQLHRMDRVAVDQGWGPALLPVGPLALSRGLEALAARRELLRGIKAHHMASLQLEVAAFDQAAVEQEVLAASQGFGGGATGDGSGGGGSGPEAGAWRRSEADLRRMAIELAADAEGLRAQKGYLENQLQVAMAGESTAAATSERHKWGRPAGKVGTGGSVGDGSDGGGGGSSSAAKLARRKGKAVLLDLTRHALAKEEEVIPELEGSYTDIILADLPPAPATAASAPSAAAAGGGTVEGEGDCCAALLMVAAGGVRAPSGIAAALEYWENGPPLSLAPQGNDASRGSRFGAAPPAGGGYGGLASGGEHAGQPANGRIPAWSRLLTGAPPPPVPAAAEPASEAVAVAEAQASVLHSSGSDGQQQHRGQASAGPAQQQHHLHQPGAAAAAGGGADGSGSGSGSYQQGEDEAAVQAPAVDAATAAADAHLQAGRVCCPVCYEELREEIVLFPCAHYFCTPCAARITDQPHEQPQQQGHRHRGACPVCRHAVGARQVFRVALAHASGAGLGSRERCDPTAGPAGECQVVGGWGTKLEALLRRLLHMRVQDPSEKALVFSQFQEALKLVGRALDVNGLRHVTLQGGRTKPREAISAFENDPDVRVFLLPLKTAAAGLTLTRASHVFLLEPALDPAIEQQAVGRVHRIGQTRPVEVHRLLVNGTVEEEVLKVNRAAHALFVENHSQHPGGAAGAHGSVGGNATRSAPGGGGAGPSGRHDAAGGATAAADEAMMGTDVGVVGGDDEDDDACGSVDPVTVAQPLPRAELLSDERVEGLLDAIFLGSGGGGGGDNGGGGGGAGSGGAVGGTEGASGSGGG